MTEAPRGIGNEPGIQQVSDEDFADILQAARNFVRNRVIPRENEIMAKE